MIEPDGAQWNQLDFPLATASLDQGAAEADAMSRVIRSLLVANRTGPQSLAVDRWQFAAHPNRSTSSI